MTSNIRNLLHAAYHGDKATRSSATQQLTAFMESPQSVFYLLELLQSGTDATLPSDQSLSALLYAKNSLFHTISSSVLETNKEALLEVERTLFSGILVVPESHRRIICDCAAVLISSCEWNYLEELLPLVVQASQGGEAAAGKHSLNALGPASMVSSSFPPGEYVKALLQLLYTYTKRFITPFLESFSLQLKVLTTLVDVLPHFLTLYPQDFFIHRLVFKVMECLVHAAFNINTKQEKKLLDSKPDIFDKWWEVLLQFLRCYLLSSSNSLGSAEPGFSIDRLPHSATTGEVDPQFVRCIKRIAKITLTVLNNATKRKQPLPCAVHFLGIALPTTKTKPSLPRRKKAADPATAFHSDPAAVSSSYSYAFMLLWENWIRCCIAFRRPAGIQGGGCQEGGGSGGVELFRKSELFAIDYLKVCTLEESLYCHHMLPQAMVLIEQVFLPFLWYNEEDHDVFSQEEDLSAFTQYMLEESISFEGEFSTRQAASNAILALIGGKKPFHAGSSLLLPLVQALGEELQLANTVANMPKLFGALHLLSILRKHLRSQKPIWEQQMHVVLAQSVAPWIHYTGKAPSGSNTSTTHASPSRNNGEEGSRAMNEELAVCVAVRAKAITVCQRYAKVPMPSEEVFSSFVQMICQSMNDEDPRIRLSGIDALCTLVEMKRARVYLSPYLSFIVAQCLEFLPKVQTTFIPTVLLYITTHFAPEIVSMLDSLCHGLVQQFLAISFDLNAMENGGEGGGVLDDPKGLQQYDVAALSADVLLRTIDSIVTSCENSQETKDMMMKGMLPDLIRLFRGVLQDNPNLSLDVLELTLTILLHTVHNCSPHIPPELWELLPLVFRTVESGLGVDVFDTIEGLLDNFISGSPVTYFTNPQLMELTLQCGEKMVLGGVVASEECKRATPLLWEAMLHQAKGPAGGSQGGGMAGNGTSSSCSPPPPPLPPGLLDPFLPRMLRVLLQSLLKAHPVDSTGDVTTRIWTLAAVMDCFYYNPALSLQVLLENEGAVVYFFQGFFHFFRGCMPQLFPSEGKDTSMKSDGNKKPKKKKEDSGFDEAKEVVSCLSLLTRKVIIVGLSSLLSYLHEEAMHASSQMGSHTSSNGLQNFVSVFFSQFLSQANALVEYCITTNYEMYVKRCETARDNLARIAAGETEDAEDVDQDDDMVLRIHNVEEEEEEDELTEEEEDDEEEWGGGENVSGPLYHSAMNGTKEVGNLPRDDRDETGLAFSYDEGDDYESPIDELNEVEYFFGCWLSKLPLPAAVVLQTVGETTQEFTGASGIRKAPEDYAQFASTASTYRQLCVQLEEAMKKDFTCRTIGAAPSMPQGN